MGKLGGAILAMVGWSVFVLVCVTMLVLLSLVNPLAGLFCCVAAGWVVYVFAPAAWVWLRGTVRRLRGRRGMR